MSAKDRIAEQLEATRERGVAECRRLKREGALKLLRQVDDGLWAATAPCTTTYRLDSWRPAFPVGGGYHRALVAMFDARIIGMDRFRVVRIEGEGLRQVTMLAITPVTGRAFLDELRRGDQ